MGRNRLNATNYYHADLIGTTRLLSDPGGTGVSPVVYTAFGERVDGTNHRYGYAGAWGYQAHDFPGDPDDPIPYLHVGWRYYDPGSGRFLQRDLIGTRGGLNVYAYVDAEPNMHVDPFGTRVGKVLPWEVPSFLWPDPGPDGHGLPRGPSLLTCDPWGHWEWEEDFVEPWSNEEVTRRFVGEDW